MATKKKKPLTAAQRRSAAAKKGWKTRRLKEKNINLLAEIKQRKSRLRSMEKAFHKAALRRYEEREQQKNWRRTPPTNLKEENQTLREENQRHRENEKVLREIAHFTATKAPKYLHRDNTLAVMPSELRHVAETFEIERALKREAKKHGGPDTAGFDEYARKVADFYAVEVAEVYTLFFSP